MIRYDLKGDDVSILLQAHLVEQGVGVWGDNAKELKEAKKLIELGLLDPNTLLLTGTGKNILYTFTRETFIFTG